MASAVIPAFSLYGEAASVAGPRFVHIETLAARNLHTHWTIAPHRHHDLHQLVCVTAGEVAASLDGVAATLAAPALAWVPARLVHGFRFQHGSEGFVLSIAEDFGHDLRPLATPLLPALAVGVTAGADWAGLVAALAAIAVETGWERPGRDTMLAAQLLVALTALARLAGGHRGNRPGTDLALFERFRLLVEQHYTRHRPVAWYADALATSRRTLHRACRRAAGAAPQELVHRRLMLEARRRLLYTPAPVAVIGYELGFADPAYFSRFFTRQVGAPPGRLRGAAMEERP